MFIAGAGTAPPPPSDQPWLRLHPLTPSIAVPRRVPAWDTQLQEWTAAQWRRRLLLLNDPRRLEFLVLTGDPLWQLLFGGGGGGGFGADGRPAGGMDVVMLRFQVVANPCLKPPLG